MRFKFTFVKILFSFGRDKSRRALFMLCGNILCYSNSIGFYKNNSFSYVFIFCVFSFAYICIVKTIKYLHIFVIIPSLYCVSYFIPTSPVHLGIALEARSESKFRCPGNCHSSNSGTAINNFFFFLRNNRKSFVYIFHDFLKTLKTKIKMADE